MKKLLFLFAIIGSFLSSTAHPVDMESAKVIASKFMVTKDLQLVTTYQTDKNIAAFYVFNTSDGFVIVAADDCETPIIGYSRESQFDPNNVPIQLQGFLQDFAARMQYSFENQIVADAVTARQWHLVKTTGKLLETKSTKVVAPLLTEKWHQGCLYNSLCPTMSGPCGHAEVGCVAVAMAQIMHYWGYPATGWGTHSYANAGTTLSADFGSTTYDWSHMPDSLNDASSEAEIEAVATLLYQCGVSVDMRYANNGSNARTNDVPNAMTRYFSYSRQLHIEKKKDFSDEEWMALLKGDLDQQRPILYSGTAGNAGHAFVCDGYDENDLFHFNWGWGGPGNGYYAMGNLNPIGYNFSSNNTAILDIIPQYEPCLVFATAYPPTAGTIEGAGEYHIGAQCTLTATPTEDYVFYCWKKNGQVVSNKQSYTFAVESDTLQIEAHFSCFPVSQLTANYSPDSSNPGSPDVRLTWRPADTEWSLMKQFEIQGETGGVASDGEHIYITYASWIDPPFNFEKYTMDGERVESFNMDDIYNALSLTYDGTDYYCNTINNPNSVGIIFRVDLDNNTIIDETDVGFMGILLAYDPEYDGFWVAYDHQAFLVDRQGRRIKSSPFTQDYIYGGGYYTAKDGSSHLLLSRDSGIYDYDITNNLLDRPLLVFDHEVTFQYGSSTGKYDGKDALFFAVDNTICIYEIKSTLAQIIGYRLYRADSEGQTVMLANEINGSSFLDSNWHDLPAGFYRFGISSIFANGNESEIIWSEPIVKTNIGIGENTDDFENSVQKVFENGQIVIIKNEKRYNVTGQQLK